MNDTCASNSIRMWSSSAMKYVLRPPIDADPNRIESINCALSLCCDVVTQTSLFMHRKLEFSNAHSLGMRSPTRRSLSSRFDAENEPKSERRTENNTLPAQSSRPNQLHVLSFASSLVDSFYSLLVNEPSVTMIIKSRTI